MIIGIWYDSHPNCKKQSLREPKLFLLWFVVMNVLGEFEGHNQRDLNKNEKWAKLHKEITPPSIQNFKAVGLWVFFLIYCSIYSFLPNVRLRFTLGYPAKCYHEDSEVLFYIYLVTLLYCMCI